MIQIFWCLCNLAWFTSKLYILLLQISFYLSPNRAKQISLLFWSTPSWISYSPSIQSKNPRFVDNSSCEDSNESDQSIETDITVYASEEKQGSWQEDRHPGNAIRIFSTTFPQTFDSHPSASGGSQLLGERASPPPCSYRDWTISKPSATNSVRLANRPYSRICRIS